jgi:hypothetical protein
VDLKQQLKNSYEQIRAHSWNFLLLVIGIITFVFFLWQMDIIVSGPVWSYNWTSQYFPGGVYANGYFEIGRIGSFKIGMTVGTGYDLCQTGMVVGLVLSILAVWFWTD